MPSNASLLNRLRLAALACHGVSTSNTEVAFPIGKLTVDSRPLAGVLFFALVAQFMTVILLAATMVPGYDVFRIVHSTSLTPLSASGRSYRVASMPSSSSAAARCFSLA